MIIHRSTDIEQQQHFHGVVPFGHHLKIEKPAFSAVSRSSPADPVPSLRLPGKTPQPPQTDLNVANSQLNVVVEVLNSRLSQTLSRFAMARAI